MLGVGDGPWHTSLEWEFDSLEEARMALLRLADMRVIGDARLAGAERFLGPDELRVRRNDAAAGRARCVFCRARIPADEETEMSLQGVAVGGLATLTCRACGLAMEWTIAPEDREA